MSVWVLYGSQTGNCEAIARRIAREADELGIGVAGGAARALDSVRGRVAELAEARLLVAVVSSTGDGEAPENALAMYRALRAAKGKPLAGLQFALLGLGDTNYETFQGYPRALDRDLRRLGADPFYACGEADEAVGLELVVEPWLGGLWDPLLAEADRLAAAPLEPQSETPPPTETQPQTQTQTQAQTQAPTHTKSPPGRRVVVRAARLPVVTAELVADDVADENASGANGDGGSSIFTAEVAARRALSERVVEVELTLSGDRSLQAADVAPGDAIAVVCPNDSAAVDAVLARVLGAAGVDGTRRVRLVSSEPLPSHLPRIGSERALLGACDLAAPPRRPLLRLLAEHCVGDDAMRAELARLADPAQGREEYDALCRGPHAALPALLEKYHAARPPLPALLVELPPLLPRYYSLSNDPVEGAAGAPRRARFAFTVVGLCTRWLASLPVGAQLPVFWRPSRAFRAPDDSTRPMVLVAAGTGVSPFMGFLARRDALRAAGAALGDCVLYFGCRHPDTDFIYREELEAWAARPECRLTLRTAFSRLDPNAPKVYVQHRMREDADRLQSRMRGDCATVYLCGDGLHLYRDVLNTLHDIFSKDEVDGWVHRDSPPRLLSDVWSP